MTVAELVKELQKQPQDATVIICSDYPVTPDFVEKVGQRRFDGYITPGFGATRRDCVVYISGRN